MTGQVKGSLHGIKVDAKLVQKKDRLGVNKRLNPTAFKGYPGLEHTSKELSEYMPNCKTFVEVFAGLGRIARYVKAENKVLNDLSDYACQYNRKNYPSAIVEQLDFIDAIKKYDNRETVLFFDPPWFEEVYSINPVTVCTMKPKDYYIKIKEMIPNLKSNWFVVSNDNGYAKLIDGFSKLIISKKNYLFGHKAKTLLVGKEPLIFHRQGVLIN